MLCPKHVVTMPAIHCESISAPSASDHHACHGAGSSVTGPLRRQHPPLGQERDGTTNMRNAPTVTLRDHDELIPPRLVEPATAVLVDKDGAG